MRFLSRSNFIGNVLTNAITIMLIQRQCNIIYTSFTYILLFIAIWQ